MVYWSVMPGGAQHMEWSVITHERRTHTVDWYWGLGFVALVGIAAALFFGNMLFAVVLALGAISIGFLAARGPREHMVRIDDRGVSIDGTRYPFSAIHSFWVDHDTESPHLFVAMRGPLSPHFSLTLDNAQQGTDLRDHLKLHVTEEEQGPHMGEHLAAIFGL